MGGSWQIRRIESSQLGNSYFTQGYRHIDITQSLKFYNFHENLLRPRGYASTPSSSWKYFAKYMPIGSHVGAQNHLERCAHLSYVARNDHEGHDWTCRRQKMWFCNGHRQGSSERVDEYGPFRRHYWSPSSYQPRYHSSNDKQWIPLRFHCVYPTNNLVSWHGGSIFEIDRESWNWSEIRSK